MKFSWEGFKNGEFVVNCDTEEKSNDFLNKCYARGLKWDVYVKNSNRWKTYENKGCYGHGLKVLNYLGIDIHNLCYASKEYFKNKNIPILSYDDFGVLGYPTTINEAKNSAKVVGETIEEVAKNIEETMKVAYGENKLPINVIKPRHYQAGNFDVITFCQKHNLSFDVGNIIKYVTRAGKKEGNSELQDLNKAMEYLKRRIEFVEKGK